MLFLLAVGFKCIRRGFLLAAAGLFCFAAECCLSFSPYLGTTVYEHLGRSFLVTFKTLLFIVLVMNAMLATFNIGLSIIYFVMPLLRQEPLPRQELGPTDEVGELARKLSKQEFVGNYAMRLSVLIAMLILTLGFLGTAWPLFFSILTDLSPRLTPSLRAACSYPRHGLVPQSDIAVKELDQVVALLAGATVLGFNLYTVPNSRHEARLLRIKEAEQRRELRLRRLAERRIELVRFGHLHTRSAS